MRSFAGRRALVTGGLGFLGAAVARALVEAGAEVSIIDARVPGTGANDHNLAGIEDSVRVVEADVRDAGRLTPLLAGQELVFNLAGLRSHLDSMRNPLADLEMNCAAQLTLLEGCRRVDPPPVIVFAGTRQVYGRPRYVPVDESHPIDPVDINGIHKRAAERYHFLYGEVYGIPVCVLRMTNTYGPGMRLRDARQTFLAVWLEALLRGDEFEIWGDGTQVRDFTYVDDAVDAFLRAAADERAHGSAFNLGGDRRVSLRELADLAVAANGGGSYRLVPFPAECRRIDIGDYAADDRAIRTLLGWEPRVALEDGLARTLEYYREHGRYYRDE